MASSEDWNFNTACFRGRSKEQMSVRKNLDAASAPQDSQHIHRRDEDARKFERSGFLDIDLNVAPPEAADCELTAADGGGSGPDTPPLPPPPALDVAPDDSSEKAGISDERELNFSVDAGLGLEAGNGNGRWIALLGVAENALREKKEEEIRKRKRASDEAAAAAATRMRISGQRRQSLAEEWNGEVAAAVVRSTRGRTVAMPSKYKDSVLGAAAEAELPRHNKNVKSATGFCTKRKSR